MVYFACDSEIYSFLQKLTAQNNKRGALYTSCHTWMSKTVNRRRFQLSDQRQNGTPCVLLDARAEQRREPSTCEWRAAQKPSCAAVEMRLCSDTLLSSPLHWRVILGHQVATGRKVNWLSVATSPKKTSAWPTNGIECRCVNRTLPRAKFCPTPYQPTQFETRVNSQLSRDVHDMHSAVCASFIGK